MHPVIEYFREQQASLEATLRAMVEFETPTNRPDLVNRMGQWVAVEFEALGGRVSIDRQTHTGDNVIGRFGPENRENGILLVGHMDTVYPEGTLARQPFRITGNAINGPGVMDMKGGLAIMLHSLKALRGIGRNPSLPITVIFNSDEETGSHYSEKIIHQESRRSRCALVYEPSQQMPFFSLRGQGSAGLRVLISGIPCHVLDPERCDQNPVLESARQLVRLESMNNEERGTLVCPTKIQGHGTVRNMVPDNVLVECRLRAYTQDGMDWLVDELKSLKPHYARTGVQTEIVQGRKPFGPGEETERFFSVLRQAGDTMHLPVERHPGFGSSDANTVAETGVPVIDCLGVVGAGAHSDHETADRDAFPLRAAIATEFLARLAC